MTGISIIVIIFVLFPIAHLERSLKIAKEEITTYTESTLSQQKDIASEVKSQLKHNLIKSSV